MEMTIEFKSRMTEIIKKDRGLFNQEKAELGELVELSFEEIKIGMEILDERYFQMQLEGFK